MRRALSALLITLLLSLVAPDSVFARQKIRHDIPPQQFKAWRLNYSCKGKTKTYFGYGRPSRAGAYSPTLKKTAKRAEFILFQHQPGGIKYWYPSERCRKI